MYSRGMGLSIRAPLVLGLLIWAGPTFAQFDQNNLASNIPGLAHFTDPNLVNPWGVAHSSTSPFWIADDGTGLSTLYDGVGAPQALVVTIPPPAGSPAGTKARPTGIVFNGTADFMIAGGASRFLFATEDGTISAWNGTAGTTAVLVIDNSATGAVYKGLALGSNASGNFLFATNFNGGTIQVFDKNFAPAAGFSFVDPTLPAGFAPFGIQNIGGTLFVTYALQDASKTDDTPGPGNGFVDAFDTDGNLLRRFASAGTLNSPWGLALAPPGFGITALLVGNFGDGRINAFDPTTGAFLTQLSDRNGVPITIDGLWGLIAGNGGNGGAIDSVYFTAGINGEADGLFGSLTRATADAPVLGYRALALLVLVLTGAGLVSMRRID
jgi:uncharacterized protein (TIGR03118 family)